MEINGRQWKIVEDYGRLWKIMKDYGRLWKIMEDYGRSQKVLWKFIEIARNIQKKSITNDHYIKKSI